MPKAPDLRLNPHPWIHVIEPGPHNPDHYLYRCLACRTQEALPKRLSQAVRNGALIGYRGAHKNCQDARETINALEAKRA